ncbi:MAG: ATP-dependent helicase HrpB [Proteobacteria bacterium]|nr:ATP-dependent helicase HrpB [Pseudomonadota bacterium]
MPVLKPLPIDHVLDQVRAHSTSGALLVRAPTGAGKTTRLPPVLDVEGAVWVVQPRRVAARAAARRMAAERGWSIGGEVGWHVRFDRKVGPNTKIVCMTSGMLLQALRRDPFLEGVGAVVFDEVHERALDQDLGLALVDALRRDAREDLLVVAMSATLDVGPLAEWLDAPLVDSEGRSFPVTPIYLDRPDTRWVEDQVADAVRRGLAEHEGDVLAFLPGVREIRRTAERLSGCDADIAMLYGDLSADKQDAALLPGSRRRVVLATNVAESSVTVPGVQIVVDAGLVRRPVFDPSTGLDRMQTQRISVASAEQRAGRAGRVSAGVCLRLWTAREHQKLRDFELPEVARVSVASALLQLLEAGIDVRTFRWLEAPSAHALEAAETLLERLGATEEGALTALGREMAGFPLHPRLARFVIEGARLGCASQVSTIAAMLSERNPLRDYVPSARTDSDLRDRLHALESGRGQPAGTHAVRRVAKQLGRSARRIAVDDSLSEQEAVGRAALAAWPDRVAKHRGDGRRARMVGGKGLELTRSSGVREPLFVAIDVAPASGDCPVRLASAVEEDWLETHIEDHVSFDASAERVRAVRCVQYGDLRLSSQTIPVEPVAGAACLERAATSRLDRVQPDDRGWREKLGRLAAVHRHLGGDWPAVDDALLRALLPELCGGRRTLGELRQADWHTALANQIGWGRVQQLAEHAPERIEVPSGSQIRLDWSNPDHPVLAVRMQEMFGLARTPTVLGGVPVRMHLLAPNMRPQQITDDLGGFWERTWPEVRKELRARYPKHDWPEDPLSASPRRRPGRRRPK